MHALASILILYRYIYKCNLHNAKLLDLVSGLVCKLYTVYAPPFRTADNTYNISI